MQALDIKELESNFQIELLAKLPITDKYRIMEYIKLVCKANDEYVKGAEVLKASEAYSMDKTFNLMLFWMFDVNVSYALCIRLLRNYVHCVGGDSDVYASKLILLGFGAMLMRNGVDTASLARYLVSLLGTDFTLQNFKLMDWSGRPDLDGDKKISIKYKEYNLNFRQHKYDLLAVLKHHKENPSIELGHLVREVYANRDFIPYFDVLDTPNADMRNRIFKRLIKDRPKDERFYLSAAKCLHDNVKIVEMHYMMNSELGKLTNFSKSYTVVIEEIEQHEKAIFEGQK